jgi:hypothetical protein
MSFVVFNHESLNIHLLERVVEDLRPLLLVSDERVGEVLLDFSRVRVELFPVLSLPVWDDEGFLLRFDEELFSRIAGCVVEELFPPEE